MNNSNPSSDSLVLDYSGASRRLAAQLRLQGADACLAADAAHDAIVETYLRRDAIEQHGAEYGYARTIALRSHWRETARRQRTSPRAHEDLPEVAGFCDIEAADDREAYLAALRNGMAVLSQRDRQLLWDHHVDGLSCAELAQRHGLRPSSVPRTLDRARRKARETMIHTDVPGVAPRV